MKILVKKLTAIALIAGLGILASCSSDSDSDSNGIVSTPVQKAVTIECSAEELAEKLAEANANLLEVKITDTNPNLSTIITVLNATERKSISLDLSECTGLTEIGNEAFLYCSKLTAATIPESVTSIGSYAFADCSKLKSINIPSSVTTIKSAAFWGCSSLKSVIIPESVTSVGDVAFGDCRSLTQLTFEHKKWYANGEEVDLSTVNISDFTTRNGAYYNKTLTKKVSE